MAPPRPEPRAWERRRGCDLSVREIKARLVGRVEQLCRDLLPRGLRVAGEWRVGSVQGERGDSLGVRLAGGKQGVWRDFATGEGGDLIDLIAAVRQCEPGEAIGWARSWLGLDRNYVARETAVQRKAREEREVQAAAERAAEAEARRKKAWKLWRQAAPIAGTPAEAYLRGRGIECRLPPTLRYLARCWSGEAGHSLPALVAVIQAVDGRFLGVHRIWLEPGLVDGSWIKAGLKEPKKTLGPVDAGAVRLSEGAAGFGVGEGLETMLAVRQALPAWRVWACLTADKLAALELPEGVRDLTVFGDLDRVLKAGPLAGERTGHHRARQLADRIAGRVLVRAVFPAAPAGAAPGEERRDWLDVLGEDGPGPIVAAAAAAAPLDG